MNNLVICCILITFLFGIGGIRSCVFEFQFRVAAQHQRMICFRIFLGTYRHYHEGSDVTSQKKGLLEYYCILFHTFQNYFITFRFSSCTESFVCTVMNRNINNSVDWSVLRNESFNLELKLLICNILHESTLISFSYTFLM